MDLLAFAQAAPPQCACWRLRAASLPHAWRWHGASPPTMVGRTQTRSGLSSIPMDVALHALADVVRRQGGGRRPPVEQRGGSRRAAGGRRRAEQRCGRGRRGHAGTRALQDYHGAGSPAGVHWSRLCLLVVVPRLRGLRLKSELFSQRRCLT